MAHGVFILQRPNTNKDEANKDAYHSFLNASWLLETIENEELGKLKSDELPKDLSADFIGTLKLQALGQAQEITIIRAVDQKNKSNLIAGLAHEVFNKYNEASDKVKGVGKIEKLREYLKARRNYNATLSYIFTGADFNENDKNGEAMGCAAAAISSLKKTEDQFHSYFKIAPKTDDKHDITLIKQLGSVVEQYDAKFKRQNDIIYYAKAPEKTPDLEATKNLVNPEKLEIKLEPDAAWTENVYKAFDVSKLVFEEKKKDKKRRKR